MGNDLRNFKGEYEALGCSGVPVVDRVSRRAPVEGRVHFDRGKLRGVVGEVIAGLHPPWIERAFPTCCGERRSPKENTGHRKRTANVWFARGFSRSFKFKQCWLSDQP